jgi:hypothetical protein
MTSRRGRYLKPAQRTEGRISSRSPHPCKSCCAASHAIENACRSTEVPARGRLGRGRYSSLLPEGAFDRIERRIGSASISVTDNTAFYDIPGNPFPTKITYCCVEADQRAVERWIIENVLPPEEPKRRPQPQRERAKRLLKKMFPKGVPPKDELPDHKLFQKCKGPEWNGISPDTVARAAEDLRKESAPSK